MVEFHTNNNVDKALVKVWMETVGEDNCLTLSDLLIWFANVTINILSKHLTTTDGEKTKEICTNEHAKMQEVYNMTGPSIQPLQIKQEKSLRFLDGTK